VRRKNETGIPETSEPSTNTPTDRRRGRRTVEMRLQEIIEQQQLLAAQHRNLAAAQRAEARERQDRLDAILGAICRTDPELNELVRLKLDEVKSPRDRELLKTLGWI
jgi:hypothetical protein